MLASVRPGTVTGRVESFATFDCMLDISGLAEMKNVTGSFVPPTAKLRD